MSSVSVIAERDEDRIERAVDVLHQVGRVCEHEEVLREHGDGTFRLKYVDDEEFTRGSLFALIEADLVEDSGKQLGRATDWQLTSVAERILEALDEEWVPRVTPYQASVIERNPSVVFGDELCAGDKFRERDFRFGSSRMSSLHKAELVEVEDGTVGAANVWRVCEIVDDITLDAVEAI